MSIRDRYARTRAIARRTVRNGESQATATAHVDQAIANGTFQAMCASLGIDTTSTGIDCGSTSYGGHDSRASSASSYDSGSSGSVDCG